MTEDTTQASGYTTPPSGEMAPPAGYTTPPSGDATAATYETDQSGWTGWIFSPAS